MKCESSGDNGPEFVQAQPMMLLPPATDMCRFCAVGHARRMPHNRDSLFYQIRFAQDHGRAPRWSDAVAHCGQGVIATCVAVLREGGVWTAEDDAAIADGTAIAEGGTRTDSV